MAPRFYIDTKTQAYEDACARRDAEIANSSSNLYKTPDPGGHERAAHAHTNALVDGIVQDLPAGYKQGKDVI